MTLGGLALAVGILVDDATVEIENINRNLEAGKEIEQAILDGAAQIATPALVSTLAICIVFVPMFFLSGVAATCLCPWPRPWSSPCWPATCCRAPLCRPWPSICCKSTTMRRCAKKHASRNPFMRFQLGFEAGFEKFRAVICGLLTLCVDHAAFFLVLFIVFALGSLGLLAPWLGQDFFPVGGCGPVQDSRTRPHRHAHRRDGSCCATTSTRPSASRFLPRSWSRSSITSGCPTRG